MMLETIAGYLEEQGVGTQGSSLFVNFMPEGVSGVLLRPFPGGVPIDHYLPGFRKSKFMVVVRTPDYLQSKSLMQDVIDALTLPLRTEIGGLTFQYMRPRTEPYGYPPSPGQLIEFVVNIDCCYC